MEIQVQKNNQSHEKITKGLVNFYLMVVLILGIYYQLKSQSGNIGTIIAYIIGDTSMATEAFIYASIFELIFILFAIIGSLLLLTLNLKHKKITIIYICIQLIILLSYIFSRMMIISGAIHMSTNGMIKNTDVSNIHNIVKYYIKTTRFTVVTLILLVGIILLPPFMIKYESYRKKKQEI